MAQDSTVALVGTGLNVGLYDAGFFNVVADCGLLGGWSILSLVSDNTGQWWCVGQGFNIAKWSASNNQWIPADSAMNNGPFRTMAIDSTNTIWSVSGADNSIAQWDANSQAWNKPGPPQQMPLLALAFDISGAMWGTGVDGAVWKWSGSQWQLQAGTNVLMIAFDSTGGMWGVNQDNNQVMRWDGSDWTPSGVPWNCVWMSWGPLPSSPSQSTA